MEYFLFLVAVLVVLFVTSQKIFTSLFYLFLKLFRSKKIVITLLAVIFFPGVVIHELAHALMAGLLQVRVGDIEFIPQLHEGGLKMGSVQIGHTDPLRRFLIGVAPIIAGSGVLLLLTSYYLRLTPIESGLTNDGFQLTSFFIILTSLFLYSIFVVTNTMFSSKKDMEGALGLLIFVILTIVIIFVAGRGEWVVSGVEVITSNSLFLDYSKKIALLLLFPLGVNMSIVTLFYFLRVRR